MALNQDLELYYKRLAELNHIGGIGSLLGWDMNVNMPKGGAQARADQMEFLSVLGHSRVTDPEFLATVDRLADSLDALPEGARDNVRWTKRGLDRERKLPEDFVAESAQTRALSHEEWVKARPKNDFSAVKPYLEKLVGLARRRAELYGYDEHPYDALLDIYDPDLTLSVAKPLLTDLGEQLSSLLPEISAKFDGLEPLQRRFDQATQHKLCRRIAEELGFSFETGRLDVSPHPFMTSIGHNDLRITTRYNEQNPFSALYGVIHETGHALYEMGLPEECHKTPPVGHWMSSSVHESQSRMWENVVGRSREFTEYLSPIIQEFFPNEAAGLDPDTLWMHVNRVEPSLIRVEADELTYALHIVIRMLLEEQLITGTLAVADLPDAWNSMYEKYLGIRPVDDKNGVMQDTHWFGGGFGYFPSYALGNLYNAIMMDAAVKAIPDLYAQISSGNFTPLLNWLRQNVHSQALRLTGTELLRQVSGQDLSTKPFVEYLTRKFGV